MKFHPLVFLFFFSFFLRAVAQPKLLTVEMVFEQVKSQNLQTKRAALDKRTQEVNVYQAKGARIPTLNANANQNYNFGRSIDPFSNQFVQQEIRANNFNLVGSIELFNGFRVWNQIAQQEQQLKSVEESQKRILNDQLLNAYSLFLQGLMSQEQIKIAQRQIENLQIQQQRSAIRIENGLETPDFLAQTNANLANVQLSLVQARGQLANAKIQILIAMQAPIDTNFNFAPIETFNLPDTASLKLLNTEQSISSLPQTKEAELRIKAAYFAVKVSRAGFYPRLVFNAGMATVFSNQNRQLSGQPSFNSQLTGFVNNDPNFPVFLNVPSFQRETVPFFEQLDRNWSQFLQFQLNIPILTGRLNRSNLMRSKINQETAEIVLEQTKNQSLQEIEQAKINFVNATERLNAQNKRKEEQQKVLAIASNRFNNGTITVFELGNIQNQMNQIEIEQTQARYEWIFRMKVLEFYQNNASFE